MEDKNFEIIKEFYMTMARYAIAHDDYENPEYLRAYRLYRQAIEKRRQEAIKKLYGKYRRP